VEVVLRFTVAGEDWPRSEEQTGVLHLRGTGETTVWQVELPDGPPGELALALPKGTYGAWLTIRSWLPPLALPVLYRMGTLVVAAAGLAEVDLPATRLDYEVVVDGTSEPGLPTPRARLDFLGYHGQSRSVELPRRTPLSGSVLLDPDSYRVRLHVPWAQGSSVLSGGVAELASELVVEPVGAQTARLDIRTLPVWGTVRVDGEDFPSTGYGGTVLLVNLDPWSRADNQGVSLPIQPGPPARFEARVLPGTYTVYFSSATRDPPSAGTALPTPAVLVRDRYRPGEPLDITLETVRVHGRVTFGGVSPGDREWVHYVRFLAGPYPVSNRPLIALDPGGSGAFACTLYAGTYTVLVGDLVLYGRLEWPVATGYEASSAPLALDITTHRVTVALTHDGGPLREAESGGRGDLVLLADPEQVPAGAEATVSVLSRDDASAELPPGRWRVYYHNQSDVPWEEPWDGLPAGAVALGEVLVAADIEVAFDIRTYGVGGRVTWGGGPLPERAGGATRGQIRLSDPDLAWRLWEPTVLPVPGRGEAVWQGRTYPGILRVTFECPWQTCPDRRLPSSWGPFLPVRIP